MTILRPGEVISIRKQIDESIIEESDYELWVKQGPLEAVFRDDEVDFTIIPAVPEVPATETEEGSPRIPPYLSFSYEPGGGIETGVRFTLTIREKKNYAGHLNGDSDSWITKRTGSASFKILDAPSIVYMS